MNFKISNHLLLVSNCIFIALYFLLAWNNRIAHDDFYLLFVVNKMGICDAVQFQYNHWCTRYASVFLSFFIAHLLQFRFTLFIYQILLLVWFVATVYWSIKNILLPYFSSVNNITSAQIIQISILIVSGIFYSSFSIGEVWFWLASKSTYIVSVLCFANGCFLLLKTHKSFAHYLLIAVLFGFVGASNESLWIFASIFFITFLFFNTKKKRQSLLVWMPFIVALLSYTICFTLLVNGNGNNIRKSCFEPMETVNLIKQQWKVFAMIFFTKISKVFFVTLLIALLVVSIFFKSGLFIGYKIRFKQVAIVSVCFGCIIFLFQLPITYYTHDLAADRTLFPISLLLFLYCNYLVIVLFLYQGRFNRPIVSIITNCILLIYSGYTLYTQILVVPNYAEAYDKRITVLNKMRETSKSIILEPLPSSGLLFSAEISTDSTHYNNQHLQQALGLKHPPIVKK